MERKINTKLSKAIFFHKNTQAQIAWDLGMGDSRLSQIKNGWVAPSEDQKKKLAEYFGKEVKELF